MEKYQCYDSAGNLIEQMYQWDKDRTIRVVGVTSWDNAAVYFNFAKPSAAISYVVSANVSEDGFSAIVPNELLYDHRPIYTYIYQKCDNDENMTIAELRIHIEPKSKPADYVYSPTESVVRIADGIVVFNGMVYLSYGGSKIGSGAVLPQVGGVSIYNAALFSNGVSEYAVGFAREEVV